MNTFSVKKTTKIILYGAASVGKIMFDEFTAHCYTIIGFVDQRAHELNQFCGLPVWSLNSVPDELKTDNNVMLYISVKNVFEHETIVRELTAANFNRIIYKPYSALISAMNETQHQMNTAYENFASDIWQELTGVPETDFIHNEYQTDYAIINESNSEVTAFIPVDYVFTNNYSNTPMEKWGNLNVLAFFTHMNFFQYLQGDLSANFKNYLEEYCLFTAKLHGDIVPTDAWKENVLRNRAQIFEQMSLSLQIDSDFFIRNAPTAEWNFKGYFNLTSGKHRATFLASKGHYLIPLKVKKEAYQTFLNEKSIQKLLSTFSENEIFIETTPIPHPFLYRTAGITKSFYYTFLKIVTKHFAEHLFHTKGTVDFTQMHIFDMSSDLGLFGIFFARMGANLYYGGRQKKVFNEIKRFAGVASKELDSHKQLPNEVNVIFIDLDYIEINNIELADIEKKTIIVICNSHQLFQRFLQTLSFSNGKKLLNTINETGVKEVYICNPI